MAPATSPWTRYSPAANRSGSPATLLDRASASARSAARPNAAERGDLLSLLTRHVTVPTGVVKPGPGLAHRSVHHRLERPWLGDGQIDVPDDEEEECDEGHVVEKPGHFSEALGKDAREPEHQAGEEKRHATEQCHPEQRLLPAVVFPCFRVARLEAEV